MTVLLSCGLGKDSSALLAMHLNRPAAAELLGISLDELNAAYPILDGVVFSDTGAEHRHTYLNLDKAVAACEAVGLPFDVVKNPKETIIEWCLRLGIVPVMGGGPHVCSKKFKGEVIHKWSEKNFDGPVTFVIGIEENEGRRTVFTPPKGDFSFVYPLVELGLDRDLCTIVLEELGWGDVEKSSCVHCPFKSEDEIRWMWKNDPDEWATCKAVEDNFEKMSPIKHATWVDAGKPLNKGGRAPRGMWRMDSWKEGRRLFVKKIGGRQLSMDEWANRFELEENGWEPVRLAA